MKGRAILRLRSSSDSPSLSSPLTSRPPLSLLLLLLLPWRVIKFMRSTKFNFVCHPLALHAQPLEVDLHRDGGGPGCGGQLAFIL